MAHCPPQGSSEHKNGRTWVDKNHELKRELIKANGGTMPYTPAFTTTPHQLSDLWSEEYLPPILFYLTVPEKLQADKTKKITYFRDKNGQLRYRPGDDKRKVRDFNDILPDRIALDVPGWMIEAWRRYDPRIQYHDILDRMTTDLGEAQKLTDMKAVAPSPNSLSNHANRNCRLLLHHFSSWGRRNEPHHTEITAIENLSLSNFMDNTVLRRGPDGKLVRVKFTRAYAGSNIQVRIFNVNNENYDQVTFDADYFLKDLTRAPEVNEEIEEALSMLWLLQERAVAHGLRPEEWERLPNECKPPSWHDRKGKKAAEHGESEETKHKRIMTEHYKSEFDGGCGTCSWTWGANWAKYKTDNDATPILNKFAWTRENEVVPRGPANRRSKMTATKTATPSTTDNDKTSSSEEHAVSPAYVDSAELPVVEEAPAAAAAADSSVIDPALLAPLEGWLLQNEA